MPLTTEIRNPLNGALYVTSGTVSTDIELLLATPVGQRDERMDVANFAAVIGPELQISITGVTGTKAEFDTACTDGDFLYVGDAPTTHATSHKTGGGDVIRLDELAVPTASVAFNDQQATSFRVENRTSDPGTPTVGQIWLRTDL